MYIFSSCLINRRFFYTYKLLNINISVTNSCFLTLNEVNSLKQNARIMTNKELQLRALSECPEEAQLLSNRLKEEHEESQKSEWEREEQEDILIAYLGTDEVNELKDNGMLDGICAAMTEYSQNKTQES